MTWSRWSGGKSPGATGAWCVLEASQTVGNIAFPPPTDGVAVAVEGVGHLLVGRLLGLCGSQDDSTTQNHRLRCGSSTDQGNECMALFGGKLHGRSVRTWHWRHPCGLGSDYWTLYPKSSDQCPGHWLRTYETVIYTLPGSE